MKSILSKYSDHLKIHWVVFIWGFTAILGRFITLSAIELVWYRMLIASVAFLVYLKIRKTAIALPSKLMLKLLATGLIVGLHWVCFFGAVKLSNVSVTLGTMATTTLFASFLEPMVMRRKMSLLDFIVAALVMAGLYMIFQFEFRYIDGILVALSAAFLAALFTVINKTFVEHTRPSVISFYEMIGGFLGISVFLLINPTRETLDLIPTSLDVLYLLLLGVVCTAYAFAVSVEVMKRLSAYYVVLSINMEPVYGIVLALLFFGESEQMTNGFYVGALVILISVILYPFLRRRYVYRNYMIP